MTPVIAMLAAARRHALVLRACYAHGELGDWDPDAIHRHLVQSDGKTAEEAQAMIDAAVQDGVLTWDEPEPGHVVESAKMFLLGGLK